MSTHNRQPELEAAIHLALDALNFDAGDWHQENIELHLQEQIALARKHLQAAISLDQQERASGLNQVKAEAVMWFVDSVAGSYESGCVDDPILTIGEVYEHGRFLVHEVFDVETPSLTTVYGADFEHESNSTFIHDTQVVEQLITNDAVSSAMASEWNDWVEDTGCFHDDFTLTRTTRGHVIEFKPGYWASRVAEHLRSKVISQLRQQQRGHSS